MTADDRCGLGAGLLALGLFGGFAFLSQLPEDVLAFLPHREMFKPEAVLDALFFVCGVPAAIWLFFTAKGAE
ncbi:MAG: hypothetical protein ABSG86_24690 [Thermoguttaceae bacterium]|jgi:hypothetical protein